MIDFSVYTASDADEMVDLLGGVFAHGDPPAVAVGLTPPEFKSFVRLFCPKAAAEALTIVARSAETGEMVGALLAEDAASPPPGGLDQLSAKFDPIFDILGQLYAEYHTGRTLRLGESIHLFLLGVAAGCAGQGIAQRLVSTCVANGAARNYSVAVTEATNKTSQYIFRKQGFVERVTRSYQDHRFTGQTFFGAIADQGGPILMDKQLAP